MTGNYVTQSRVGRLAVVKLHEMCQELFPDAELKEQEDPFDLKGGGSLYVSVPTSSFTAIEVETYETPRTLFFTLHRRAWTGMGGLAQDKEVGETSELYLMLAMIKAEMEQIK